MKSIILSGTLREKEKKKEEPKEKETNDETKLIRTERNDRSKLERTPKAQVNVDPAPLAPWQLELRGRKSSRISLDKN